MSDYLPPEVLFEIFSRLPVKSLLHFRSVSKHWRSTISSLHFFDAHLTNSSERPCVLFSRFLRDGTSDIEHFTLHPHHRTIEDYSKFECPLENKPELRFVGSCNGLFCLSDRSDCVEKHSIIVWNPSIRRYATLPSTRIPKDTLVSYIWFGFDLISKDYKVIRTITFREQLGIQTTPPPMTEVYALGRGCWKAISSAWPFHCFDILLWEQVYTNGACHRVGLTHPISSGHDYHMMLLSFDLGDEVFRVIDTPVEMNVPHIAAMGIQLFQDMVSVFCDQVRGDGCTVSIWVMRDYGVVESWTKQYNFNYGVDLDFPMWSIDTTLFACNYVETLALLGGSRMDILVRTHSGDFDLRTLVSAALDGGGEDEGSGMAVLLVTSIAGTIVEFLLTN